MCKWLPAHAVAARNPAMGRHARQAGTPHRGGPAARRATGRLTPGTGGAIVGRSGSAPGAPMTSWLDAPRRSGLSLRARLLVMWALSAALVVGGATYVQRRIIVSAVEDEAVEAAGATALGVAAELTEREGLPSAAELDDLLADFQRMVPAVRGLTVTRIEPGGESARTASGNREYSDVSWVPAAL